MIGDLLQLNKLSINLIGRLSLSNVAASNLRGLHHNLGHGGLVHNGLLSVRDCHEPSDKPAAEMLAGDHSANENDSDADRKADLRSNSKFQRKFDALHPKVLGWLDLVNCS